MVSTPWRLCLLIILLLSSATQAEEACEVIHLRTGEVVKGIVLAERCTEEVLVVRDLVGGAVREIAWDLVDPEDRVRLQVRSLGWGGTPTFEPLDGVGLSILREDGTREDVVGLLEAEDAETVVLRWGGTTMRIRKSQVVARSGEALDPREIWTPAQLVGRFLARLAQAEGADLERLTSRQHLRAADFARAVGDYDRARLHYAACAQDAAFRWNRLARRRLAEVDDLLGDLRDRAALAALKRVRAALWRRAYREARALLEAFPAAHPKVGEAIERLRVQAVEDFQRRRAEHHRRAAAILLPRLLTELIQEQVREECASLADVTAWTRRELPDSLFAVLAQRLSERDDVTPEEARVFWEQRSRAAWRTASYGSGTFIVDPVLVVPGVRDPGLPRPPTRSLWWQRASAAERGGWITAYFVENAGVFEVSGLPGHVPCPLCAGRGLHEGRLCPRCGGAQTERTVRYR